MKLTKTEYYSVAALIVGWFIVQLFIRHFMGAFVMVVGFTIGRIWRHYE